MIRLIVLVTLITLSYGLTLPFEEVTKSFEKFKADHGVTYGNAEEESQRFMIFAENLAEIKAHNERADNGQHSYRLGVNKFADLTREEFSRKHLGLKGVGPVNGAIVHKKVPTDELPLSVDWRDKGAVTPVKNQGDCGSCWAFSAVAAIEGAHFISNGQLISLSEQNVVDCDRKLNAGCDGGWPHRVYNYVIGNKGLDTESGYPYEAQDDKCRYNPEKVGATISSYANITSGDEDALLSAVAQQPVSVVIDSDVVQLYESGIVDSPLCGSTLDDIDHAVTVIGYGTEGAKDYWIVKNSWGSDWGESGYFRLVRGSNMCAVATAASYPIV